MELLKFLFVAIVAYQVSSLITESSFPVFSWLRKLPYLGASLFSCVLCVSVWMGWFSALFIYNPGQYLNIEPVQYSWFWSGFVYSFFAWTAHLLEGKLYNG
jgi:hypothetical protein